MATAVPSTEGYRLCTKAEEKKNFLNPCQVCAQPKWHGHTALADLRKVNLCDVKPGCHASLHTFYVRKSIVHRGMDIFRKRIHK